METNAPRFEEGMEVLDRAKRHGLGRIQGAPQLIGGEWHYQIRFEGGITRKLAERHIEPQAAPAESLESLVLGGEFGPLETFQRALAVARIRKEAENRTTVYSYNAQRIQFQPHQYKPLLRFLDSEDGRLLIADEVGLGKTIEAGIILAELEARRAPERVLVLCPSRLTEKWSEELNRKFSQDFQVWRGKDIRDYARRVRQNPHRVQMRAIVSLQGIRQEQTLESLLEAVEQIDLLIVDEAHHARNRGTSTYSALESLTEISSAVLFLTATPIHLGSNDLFNQLRLLRPTDFSQPEVFAQALQRNEGVVRALATIRKRDASSLARAAGDVERSFKGGLGAGEGVALVEEVLRRMRTSPPQDLRQWIDLEHDTEKLHYLANILTRSRKRDVQEHAGQRRANVKRVRWTAEEQATFRSLVGRDKDGSWPARASTFGMIQQERMAASSLIGTLYYRGDSRGIDDMRADSFDEELELGADERALTPTQARASLRQTPDSKLQSLLEILQELEEAQPGCKILIFTYFVGTSRYLEDALNRRGWKASRIAGDVASVPGQPDKDERSKRVRAFRDDPAVRVMVSTEVGSEGLDFQFCSTVINFDLPWNPMTVEQRIGRIDRFGQKAEVLTIWSLVVEGTVEERILARLYSRIGVFERSIGSLETILGEVIAELRKDYFEGRLRPEEAEQRLEEAANAIENQRKNLDELDQAAERLFGHEDTIRSELERIRRLGRYVTPESLLQVVSGYLARRHAQVRVVNDGDGAYSLRMPDALHRDIMQRCAIEASDATRMRRFTRDGRFYFALEGHLAYDRPDVDLLNASHPLVLTALASLEELLADPRNRAGAGRLLVDGSEGIPAGTYLAASFRVDITGVSERTVIETAAVDVHDGALLDPELAERLLHLVLIKGEDAASKRTSHCITQESWLAVQGSVAQRVRSLEEKESKENELLMARRRSRAQEEFERQMSILAKTEATAMQRETLQTVGPMIEGRRDRARAALEARLEHLRSSSHVQTGIDPDPVAVCLVTVTWISEGGPRNVEVVEISETR